MKTVLHVLMFTIVTTFFLSGSVSALGLFSVQSDQVATNTYHFTEDPDFYQADRNIIDFYYDFGDGKGTSEHNPIYTYQVPGTYSPA